MAKSNDKTSAAPEPAAPVSDPNQAPGARELGEQWTGVPDLDDNEFGYKPENNAPKYDFDANDDHVDPNDESVDDGDDGDDGDESGKAVGEPKPLSRDDWADYGLTEQQARNFDTKGELEAVLDLMDQRFASLGQKDDGEGEGQRNSAAKKQDVPQLTGPLKLELDPDMYEEALVKQVGSLVDHVNTLQQRLEAVTGSARRERMDGYFASLGEEYESVFGKGSLDDLPSNSPMRQRRIDVETTVEALRAGYEKIGQPVPGEKSLLTRATRVVAGSEMQSVARKQAAQQSRDAKGQFIAKPTHREGKPLSRSERAAQFAEQFYKRKGM